MVYREGFPERVRLDYNSGLEDEVPARFLGRGLVRGYRSYLDVMQKDWRQYTAEPDPNVLINCNVIATGCWNHANEYWVYAVDMRQFITILFNEPRFLSITPDLGLIDLTAEETSPLVKFIAKREILKQGKTDFSSVAFPIVTGAWYNPQSHVPSPVLYTKDDGTQVTNFAQSLALWIGVDNANISSEKSAAETCSLEPESFPFLEAGAQSKFFFDAVRERVRRAENSPMALEVAKTESPGEVECPQKARFGVSKAMARVNYPFSATAIDDMIAGYYESAVC